MNEFLIVWSWYFSGIDIYVFLAYFHYPYNICGKVQKCRHAVGFACWGDVPGYVLFCFVISVLEWIHYIGLWYFN